MTRFTDFLSWMVPPLYKSLEDKIGWKKLDPKYWFGAREATMLINAIKQICPPLTIEKDFGLHFSCVNRFYNNARKRKPGLGIFPKSSKGKLYGKINSRLRTEYVENISSRSLKKTCHPRKLRGTKGLLFNF